MQAIAKRLIHKMLSPAPTSKYNMKYVNLSEEFKKGKDNQLEYSSSLTSKPSPTVKEIKTRDKEKKNTELFSQDIHGIWGPGVNLEKEKNPKTSLLKFVLKRLRNSRTKSSKNIKKSKASLTPLLAVPSVEPEIDSYLKALEESRIPCQTLEDPSDCDDFSQLFRPFWSYNYDTNTLIKNEGLSTVALSNDYLSSLKNIIQSSQIESAQPSADSSNDFLLQKPILFLSPNIKFTIYHHSSPTIQSSDDEIALPSFDVTVEADSPSPADSPIEPETSSFGSIDDETSGLEIVGPLSTMKVVPIST